MTIVGVDLSTLRIDLAWLDETGRPQRWHQVIGDPKKRAKKQEDVIDSLRRIRILWPRHHVRAAGDLVLTSSHPEDVTDVCIEYPRGQNHVTTAKLAAVAGVITRQAPTWSRVAWMDSRDLRAEIGARNTKTDAHNRIRIAMFLAGPAPVTPDTEAITLADWDEHELDALVACVAWTRILEAQETAA